MLSFAEQAAAQIRNPKSEFQKKSENRNPRGPNRGLRMKPDRRLRLAGDGTRGKPALTTTRGLAISVFGFRPSFGFRISGFGFRSPTALETWRNGPHDRPPRSSLTARAA